MAMTNGYRERERNLEDLLSLIFVTVSCVKGLDFTELFVEIIY